MPEGQTRCDYRGSQQLCPRCQADKERLAEHPQGATLRLVRDVMHERYGPPPAR